MKKKLALIATIALSIATAVAQSSIITVQNLGFGFSLLGLSQNIQTGAMPIGQPFPLNGQTVLITTNAQGLYTISSSGPLGTNSITPPNTIGGYTQTGEQWLANNNPSNSLYYASATNEIDFRVGVMYLQSSGQAVASLGIDYYGAFGYSNVGFGGGLLEGNNNGQQGTAAGYGEVVYRKPIGDVAFEGGVVGGYDLWHRAGFGGVKVGLEYRQNAHLGEFIEVAAVAENSSENSTPILVGGGIIGAF